MTSSSLLLECGERGPDAVAHVSFQQQRKACSCNVAIPTAS